MIGVFKSDPPEFEKFFKLSLTIHTVFFTIALVGFAFDSERVFVSPMYATVDIISQKKSQLKPAVKKVEQKKQVKKKTPVKVKTKKVITPAPTIDDLVKEIESNVSDEDIIISKVNKLKAQEQKEQAEIDDALKALKDDLKEYDEDLSKVTPLETESGGVTGSRNKVINSAYLNRISEKVKSRWVYTGENNKIETIVSLKIAQNGTLVDLWVEETSGEKNFDDSVIKAIKKAAPFPPLPEEITVPIFEFGFRFCGDKGCKD